MNPLSPTRYAAPFMRRYLTVLAMLLPISAAAQTAQIISNYTPPTSRAFHLGTLSLSATGGASGNPVVFASTTPNVCTVSGATVSLAALGTCTVTANQAGNATYLAAPALSRNIQITIGTQIITFANVPDKPVNSAPFSVSASVVSGLPINMTSNSPAICSVTAIIASSGTTVATIKVQTLGICSLTASQPGNSVYNAAAITRTFDVVRVTQTITFAALPQREIGVGGSTSSFNVAATATSGLQVVFASSTPTICTASGSTVTMAAIGSCAITTNQAGDASTYAASPVVTRTFNVVKNAQSISFAALPNIVLGSNPITLNATASSALLISYATTTPNTCSVAGNTLSVLGVGMCSVTATQAGNAATWAGATAITRTLTITKKPQTITFAALPGVAATAAPFTVSATASSGLPVSFIATTATVCTATGTNGNTITVIKSGTCTIAANQSGDDTTWLVAPKVARSFSVTKVAQAITFPVVTPKIIGAAPFSISATASSGLAVSVKSNSTAVCTIAANTVTIVAAGTCSLAASQPGDGVYSAAPNVTRSFAVTKVLQSIVFAAIAPQTMTTPPITVSALASSSLPVTITSLSTAICSVSGSTVTLVAAGRCNLRATQAGNATYAAAPQANQSFTIAKLRQTIIFAALSPLAVNQGPVALSATATSGLAVSFSTNSATVCTVSGTNVALLKAGTCSISATQVGNGNYDAAPKVTRVFNVTKILQTITFPAIANQPLSASPLSFTVSASSSLPVTLSSRTTAVCTVAGSSITLVKVGSCTIVAIQAGDASYSAAPQVSRAFSVTNAGPAAQAISNFTPATPLTFAPSATFSISATGGASGNAVTFGSGTPAICTLSGNIVTLVSAGICELTADQAGNTSYAPATQAIRSVTINPGVQTIDPGPLPGKQLDAPPFSLNANSSAGLHITYNSIDTSICTVAGNTVTIVAIGICTITGDQPGDSNYLAAPQVTRSINITPAAEVTPAAMLTTGMQHACAITSIGGLKCWGWNELGQLGDGTTINSSVPVDVVGLAGLPGQPKVRLVEAGSAHTCAIVGSGSVKCWGNNYAGQLGDGTNTQRNVPADVVGVGSAGVAVIALAAGDQHTCGLTNDGLVKCWGTNLLGELGDGTGIASTSPVEVAGLTAPVTSLRASNSHTCVILGGATPSTPNQAMCWGQNFSGQLGDGNTYAGYIATPVSGLNNPIDIAPGAYHTCALESDSAVKCWGSNSNGQLGTGNNNSSGSLIPITVPSLAGVTQLASGGYGSCTVLNDGSINCWGNIANHSPSPTPVLGLDSPALNVHVGNDFVCALERTGAIECWRSNSVGQLGDGTTTFRDAAELVTGFTGTPLFSQTINFPTITYKTWGVAADMSFTVSATASSGLAVTLTSLTPSICNLSGDTVTLINGGTCTLAANQPGDATNIAAPQVTRSFTIIVNLQSQTLTDFAPPGNVTLLPLAGNNNANNPNTPNTLTLSAAGGASGNPIVFTSTTPTICATSGTTSTTTGSALTFLALGICTVTADQAGNVGYSAAQQLSADIQVQAPPPPSTQTITGLASSAQNVNPLLFQTTGIQANTYSLNASGGASGNPVMFGSSTPTVCTVTNAVTANGSGGSGTGTVTLLTAGLCTITADQAGTPPTQSGDGGYNAAAQVTLDLNIGYATQTISFAAITDKLTNDSPFAISAASTANLTVRFSSQTPAICSVTAGSYNTISNITAAIVTVNAVGQCTIAADQAGTNGVSAALQVTQSFAITAGQRKVYYIHSDHLNTPRAITETMNNTKVWEWKNEDAFGNNAPDENPNGANGATTFKYNLRFPGQYFDQETGTMYNYFRDYDPSLGRYVQSDPIGLAGGINTYAYVNGNPLSSTDPTGELPVGAAARVLLPAIVFCMRIPACKKAVEEAIKACKNVECKLERHKRHHRFDSQGKKFCEHYSLRCYVKGAKGTPPIFEAQWPLPGRCTDEKGNDWLP